MVVEIEGVVGDVGVVQLEHVLQERLAQCELAAGVVHQADDA